MVFEGEKTMKLKPQCPANPIKIIVAAYPRDGPGGDFGVPPECARFIRGDCPEML